MQIPNDAVDQLDQIMRAIGYAGLTFMGIVFVVVGVLVHESRKNEKPYGKNSTTAR